MTTKRQADKLANAMLRGLPRSAYNSDDYRRAHKIMSRKVRRTFNELERKLCHELPTQCEGKSQGEIANILGRAIDGVKSTEMDLIELEFLDLLR